MTASPKSSVAAQLAALPQLPQDRLWALWDEHFPRRPKRVHRRYLEARLAYRLQEIALGGLPPAVKAHLADCGEQHSKIKVGRGPEVRMMPGTTLIREALQQADALQAAAQPRLSG